MCAVQEVRDPAPAVSWQTSLEGFMLAKRASGLRERTLADYKYFITTFFRSFPNAWHDPASLKQACLEWLGQRGMASQTFNKKLTYLRVFLRWCQDERILKTNPVAGFKVKRTSPRIVDISEDVLKRLLALPDRKTFTGRRDYALLLLTLDTGIRPGEAFKLTLSDINFQAAEVYVRGEVSKTGIRRTLPVSPVTLRAIRDLIAARHPSWGEEVPLFCSENARPLDKDSWGARLHVYSQQLGCKVKPYDLRHVFALQFLRAGGNAFALQRLLGHSDMSMTQAYVALTQGDLKTQHTLASPLNALVSTKPRAPRRVK